MLEDALAMLSHVEALRYGPTSKIANSALVELLGTGWLSDDVISLMVCNLEQRLVGHESSVPGRRAAIIPLAFSNKLVQSGAAKRYAGSLKEQDWVMRHYEELVKEDGVNYLVFPVNQNSNHWITVALDFTNGEIHYGDSLFALFTSPPYELFRAINLWLKKRFNRRFKVPEKPTLPSGQQRDTFNCGVCFGVTLESLFFQADEWASSRSLYHRIAWFIKLAKDSIPPPSPNHQTPTPLHRRGIPLADLLNPAASIPAEDQDSAPMMMGQDSDNAANDGWDSSGSDSDSMSSANSESESDDNDNDNDKGKATAIPQHSPAPSSHYSGDLPESSVCDSSSAPASPRSFANSLHPSSPALSTTELSEPVDPFPDAPPIADVTDVPMPSPPPSPTYSKPERKASPVRNAFSVLLAGAAKVTSSAAVKKKGAKNIANQTVAAAKRVLGRKRARSESDTNSDGDTPSRGNGDGRSASAKHGLNLRKAARDGTLIVDPVRLHDWKEKMRRIDPECTPWDDGRTWTHSKCAHLTKARGLKVKYLYDLTRAREHHRECTHTKPTNIRLKFFSSAKRESEPTKPVVKSKPPVFEPTMIPCPGLTERLDGKIKLYLRRTGFSGGGGKDRIAVAIQLFKKTFGLLGAKERAEVLAAQERTHTWDNKHSLHPPRVFARDCSGMVLDLSPHPPMPCNTCLAVYRSKAFKNALRKPPILTKNYRHVNRMFRPEGVGEIYAKQLGVMELMQSESKRSPFVRYALGALKGKYDDKIFRGLTQAMITMHDKEDRGVGKSSFRYSPEYTEFMDVINIHSPSAYRALRDVLPAPTERHFQKKRATQPRFPLEICPRTFELATEYLAGMSYAGPVGLSCDDTALTKRPSLFWDSQKQKHLLVGVGTGPIEVPEADSMQAILEQPGFQLAHKLRVWCVLPQVPGAVPIILHAMPLVTGMTAETLEPYSRQLLVGLIKCGVRVVSYACDGTEIERAIQRLLCKNASYTHKYKIPAPTAGGSLLEISFAVYHGQAVAMLQDSKHSAKTFRNNLFSGAHLITIGNYPAFYAQIHALAKLKGSPLFMRDVEKLDRQDDGAASRLFSADTLQFLSDNHPEWTGTAIYLFVLGEVVDAYQSRSIGHGERLTMVLRAHYFLEMWIDYLEAAKYSPRSRFFISRECVDILHFLITGYIALLVIHRDHLDVLTPLLPWLHSSEPCEHTFGICRKIIKDFTYWDFLHMAPKLRLTLRRAVLRDRVSSGKARASGYNITYYQTHGIDPLLMAQFPSDDEIPAIVEAAYSQAEKLAAMAGIDIDRTRLLLNRDNEEVAGLSAWFTPESFETIIGAEGVDEMISEDECDPKEDPQQLIDLLAEAETGRFAASASVIDREKLKTLACAGASLMLDSTQKVRDFAAAEPDDDEDILAEESNEIRQFLRATISPPSIPDVVLTPSLFGRFGKQVSDPRLFDISHMIALRREHQTFQAANGVKTKVSNVAASPRVQISRALNDVLRQYRTQGATSGEERKIRTKAMSGTNSKPQAEVLTGNSKNALVVATQNAKSDSTKRRRVFNNICPKFNEHLITGRISPLRPLSVGDFILVALAFGTGTSMTKSVVLGRVLTFYSRSGAKNSTHSAVMDGKDKITAFSNVVIQVFEYQRQEYFGPLTKNTRLLGTFHFTPVPAIHVLSVVSPKISGDGANFRAYLIGDDRAIFDEFKLKTTKIFDAIKSFKSRKKKQTDEDEGEGEGDGDEE